MKGFQYLFLVFALHLPNCFVCTSSVDETELSFTNKILRKKTSFLTRITGRSVTSPKSLEGFCGVRKEMGDNLNGGKTAQNMESLGQPKSIFIKIIFARVYCVR